MLADAAGTVLQSCVSRPYGNGETCSPTPTEHLFTGKEHDQESGNDYFGARYYGSSMGRWMSPDGLNLTDERILNPANTLNKYVYGGNNPLKYIDQDGTTSQSFIECQTQRQEALGTSCSRPTILRPGKALS